MNLDDFINVINTSQSFKGEELLNFLDTSEEQLKDYYNYPVYIEDIGEPVSCDSKMRVVKSIDLLPKDMEFIPLGTIKGLIDNLRSIEEEVDKELKGCDEEE